MYKVKFFGLIIMSMFLVVLLSACGKGAEGELEGKSFELVDDSGDVLGEIKFEEDGSYRVKDKDPFDGGEGIGEYEVFSKEDKDYLIFKTLPDDVAEFLDSSLSFKGKILWEIEDMKFYSVDSTTENPKEFKEYNVNEIVRDPRASGHYDFKLKALE